jgi:serine/threonine-protein kinase
VTGEAENAAPVQPGDVLAGKYRVERILGVGGMGVVVAAHHVQLDERVALKFLLPEALANEEAVARFGREARAAVKIKNEHVARVTDVGQLENGSPYIVMEYLEGEDLSAWLEKRGAMPVDQAVDFVLQACEAIAEAHSLGIVHRDLKPANLFCIQRADGPLCIKVLDFGISKVTAPGGDAASMTRTRAVVGSPHYMSPEQMTASREVDSRADIWSLGVILFELVAGRPPFEAAAITELAIKVAIEPAVGLRTIRADVPVGLEQVVATCLEKDRTARFQTVAELATALLPFAPEQSRLSVERVVGTLRRAGVTARTTAPVLVPQPEVAGGLPHAQTQASWENVTSWKKRARIAAGGVAVTLGVGALVVLGVLWRSGAASTVATVGGRVDVPPATASSPEPASSAAAVDAAVALAPAASASSTAAPVAVGAHPKPATTPSHPAHAAPSRPAFSATKASCDPPYYFDAKGTRIFKKECL